MQSYPSRVPYTITGAPQAAGKVYIGQSGSEWGQRGYLTAYDAETGEKAWRFFTVPGDPAQPFEHSEMDLAAKTWNGESRQIRSPAGGDNLFLVSIVAVDPDSGEMKWYCQTTPGDKWDYTATQNIVLADMVVDRKERKVLLQAPKNGFGGRGNPSYFPAQKGKAKSFGSCQQPERLLQQRRLTTLQPRRGPFSPAETFF